MSISLSIECSYSHSNKEIVPISYWFSDCLGVELIVEVNKMKAGTKKVYWEIKYRLDFGTWTTPDTQFESLFDAHKYATEKYYHYRIFRVEKICFHVNPVP